MIKKQLTFVVYLLLFAIFYCAGCADEGKLDAKSSPADAMGSKVSRESQQFIKEAPEVAKLRGKISGTPQVMKKTIEGNFELNMEVAALQPHESIKVFFSGSQDMSSYAYMQAIDGGFRLGRVMDGKNDIWKEYEGINSLPWKIRVLKKGNYFRFWVNGVEGDIRSPMGEWEGKFDPWTAVVGAEVPEGSIVNSFTITTLPWLTESKQLWGKGPEGSWHEEGSIPGAIIEFEGRYYMYFLAHRRNPAGGEGEAAALRCIGGAWSDDLINWTVNPEPLITTDNLPGDNIYPNAATILPDGKIALLFSVQQMPVWIGFFLATADEPLGEFTMYEDNPVYKHFTHAHEFDVLEVNHPDYKYIMMYSGYTPNPPSGPSGDRGYAVYSNDLIHWWPDERNPVFNPETLTGWDCTHIRPRGLNKIDDTYYLWYEGCVNWMPPKKHHGWWDTVGLARSKDLVHWEHYPRNPALPGLGIGSDHFDSTWIGWPKMLIRDGIAYVYFTGPGIRTIEVDKLTNWETEGGKTINMLK